MPHRRNYQPRDLLTLAERVMRYHAPPEAADLFSYAMDGYRAGMSLDDAFGNAGARALAERDSLIRRAAQYFETASNAATVNAQADALVDALRRIDRRRNASAANDGERLLIEADLYRRCPRGKTRLREIVGF
jgi:hypothetical protein